MGRRVVSRPFELHGTCFGAATSQALCRGARILTSVLTDKSSKDSLLLLPRGIWYYCGAREQEEGP